jgi:hypothetical protein
VTVANGSPGGDAGQTGFAVSAELSTALTAQGPHGERALNLLRDAAAVLSDPGRWHAPYEVSQSCCRGAIDSILNLAPRDIEGIEAARGTVTDTAKSTVEAWRAHDQVPEGLLDELAAAVDALRAEEANPGGRRIRQIGHLVQELTRQEMGLAEVEAVRNSWTRFYRDTSGVLHGSGATPEESRERFEGVVASFEQLFLGLPERAERLRQLALSEQPSPEDAAEIASMSDPRAGGYFFRAAVSRRWLGLLPLDRLLPEASRWPALPYLRRLLDAEAPQVCAWVQQHLAAIEARGGGATGMAVSLVAQAGMTACALLQQIARTHEDRHVLLRISYWARDVPMSDRSGQWVRVVEEVLRTSSFGTDESWEAAQLAHALVQTAHPEGQLRPAGDRLGVITRSALASVLAAPLAEVDAWQISLVNDLREISLADPPRDVLFTLMRAVLDLTRQDARLGVPLSERWRVLDNKLPAGAAADRLRAGSFWRATTTTGPMRRRPPPGGNRPCRWRVGWRLLDPRARMSRTSSPCSRAPARTSTVAVCTRCWSRVWGRHRPLRRSPPGGRLTRRRPSRCRMPGTPSGRCLRSWPRRYLSRGGRCWRCSPL